MTGHRSATPRLPYAASRLDRAGNLRRDDAWVAATSRRPDTRVLPLWRDRCLVRGTPGVPVRPCRGDAGPLLGCAPPPVLLGRDGDAGVLAVDLSGLDEGDALALTGADATCDLRRLVGGLDPDVASTLAYARGMLHWHRSTRFCGTCGGPTTARHGGHVLACTPCDRLLFPRLEPAVIVLVESPGPEPRCLLGRHRHQPAGRYSTLAGFVEVGESLEDAVHREVAEEAGVTLDTVTYRASQAWPFPSGIMLGFSAVAASERVDVDADELLEACWFTPDQVVAMRDAARADGSARPDSIEDHLVGSWLREHGRARD